MNSPTFRWCVLLALLALVWRLPIAATAPMVAADEVTYSRPTVLRMLADEPLFYIAGTNYGAPVHEALAVPLVRWFGESKLTLRLPVVVLGSVGVAMSFLVLRRVAGGGPALGIALLMALGHSVIIRYTSFAHPLYAALSVLIPAGQLLAFRVDEERRMGRWIALGLCLGFAMYVLKVAIFAAAAVLAWLWWRSEHGQLWRAQWGEVAVRKRGGKCALLFAGAGAVALPVLYRFLTRRESFTASALELALAGTAAILAIAAAIVAIPFLRGASHRAWLHAAVCLGLMLAVPMPAALWYRHMEKPRLEARGTREYDEAAYTWKHAHEWPTQARIVLEGMLPAFLIGRETQLEHNPKATWPWTWEGALSVAFLAALGAGLSRKMREHGWRAAFGERDFVLIAPFFLTLAVMLPSWLLFSDYSFRYLLPFLPGLYLFAYRCLELPIQRHRRAAVGLLAAYLVYCGIDAWHFSAW